MGTERWKNLVKFISQYKPYVISQMASNFIISRWGQKICWQTLESRTFQSTPSVPDSTVQWQNELFSQRLYSPELFSPRPFSLELFSPRPFSPELFSPRLYSPMEKWTFQSQTFQSWTLQSKTFQSWTFQSQTFQSQTLQSQGQNELFSPRPKRQLF